MIDSHKIKFAKCSLNRHHTELGIETEENNSVVFGEAQYLDLKLTAPMIIGAGDTGSALIRSMRRDTKMRAVVAIDDDESKHGMLVAEVPVVGGRNKILSAVKEYKVQEGIF